MYRNTIPRILIVLALVLVLASTSTLAQSARLGSTTFTAWRDGEDLYVALGNDSGARKTITLLVENRDDRWRPTFDERRVTLPADSVLVESFSSAVVRRGTNLILTVTEGSRTVEIPIQVMGEFSHNGFVVEANTVWESALDLEFLLSSDNARLLLDDFYTITGPGSRGRIQVKVLEGGLKYSASSNSIEFERPYVVLSMRAPNINGISLMTFNARRVSDSNRGRGELVTGPTVMVYGRNIRFIDNTGGHNTPPITKPPMIRL